MPCSLCLSMCAKVVRDPVDSVDAHRWIGVAACNNLRTGMFACAVPVVWSVLGAFDALTSATPRDNAECARYWMGTPY